MPDTFESVTRKLMENETAIGHLYELFSLTFPPDAELWTRLARDEHQHAEWIRQASDAAAPEQRERSPLSIRLAAVENMIQHVGLIAERCRRKELTRINALALGRDLESSLLESKILGTLSSGAAGLAGLELALVQATADHRRSLVEALDRVQQRP
jgi:hypothetical protein